MFSIENRVGPYVLRLRESWLQPMTFGTDWKSSAVREDEGVPSESPGVEERARTSVQRSDKLEFVKMCEVTHKLRICLTYRRLE